MPPEEQMIVLHLFIPELKAGQPQPCQAPGGSRQHGAEPRVHRDGPHGLIRPRRRELCRHRSLRLSCLFFRWENEAREELEVAEALRDLKLPQPCRHLPAGCGGREGGAEPHAAPPRSPPPQPRRGCSRLADVREIPARAQGGEGGCEAVTNRQRLPAAAGGQGAAAAGTSSRGRWRSGPRVFGGELSGRRYLHICIQTQPQLLRLRSRNILTRSWACLELLQRGWAEPLRSEKGDAGMSTQGRRPRSTQGCLPLRQYTGTGGASPSAGWRLIDRLSARNPQPSLSP